MKMTRAASPEMYGSLPCIGCYLDYGDTFVLSNETMFKRKDLLPWESKFFSLGEFNARVNSSLSVYPPTPFQLAIILNEIKVSESCCSC